MMAIETTENDKKYKVYLLMGIFQGNGVTTVSHPRV